MNKITLLIAFTFLCIIGFAQNAPITFEDGEYGADWSWKTFENDDDPALEIVDNPDKTTNTSNKVAKFTSRENGNPYAGCETLHGSDIGEYTMNTNNPTVTIMVYKTVISDVGIKLVTATGWAKPELKVANTKINEWEKITFDFSTVDHENMTYDQLVIFPDFKDRSQDNVSYFDNITFGDQEVNSTEVIENSKVKIYPNPSTDKIKIYNPNGLDIESFSIMNFQGQIVKSSEYTNGQIDITDLVSGLYSIKLRTSEGFINQKILID